jgi:hypothetical protein
MSDTRQFRCRYSASGHNVHPIQARLARQAGDPVPMTIVGPHDKGIVVAPASNPDHVEVWCMHQRSRDLVSDAVALGFTSLLSWEHGFAKVGEEYISHTTPETWRECPAPDELLPWETGFIAITKDCTIKPIE